MKKTRPCEASVLQANI